MQLTAVRTLTQALAAPALSSSIAGATATLNWTAPTPTGQSVIAGYRIFKSATVSGTYTQVGGALPPTQLTLADTLSGTQFYKVEAFDQFATGGRSAGLQCNPIVTGGKFKFNPSIAYIYIDQNQSRSAQLARMQALKAANPWIKGFQVFWDWSDFENPALVGGAAQYDGSWASQTDVNAMAGFKLVDTFLAACVAMGCQFSWHIYSYGGSSAAGAQSTSFPNGFAPAYLAGTAYGPNTASTNGVFGGVWINSYAGNSVGVARYYRYWVPAVMARIIACWTAYGARYDSHPNLEVVSFLDESAMSTETSYSDAGAAATMIGPGNYFQALRAAWPTTALRWWGNYVGSSVPRMDDMLAAAFASQWSIGGPDTCNESGTSFRAITADWRYRGLTSALGNGGVVDPTVPDYRTLGANNMRQVEPEDLNNPPSAAAGSRHLGDGNLVHIVQQANLMAATHEFWYDNRFAGPDTNQTATGHPNLLDFLNSARQGGNVNVNGVTAGVALTNISYPSSWPQS